MFVLNSIKEIPKEVVLSMERSKRAIDYSIFNTVAWKAQSVGKKKTVVSDSREQDRALHWCTDLLKQSPAPCIIRIVHIMELSEILYNKAEYIETVRKRIHRRFFWLNAMWLTAASDVLNGRWIIFIATFVTMFQTITSAIKCIHVFLGIRKQSKPAISSLWESKHRAEWQSKNKLINTTSN